MAALLSLLNHPDAATIDRQKNYELWHLLLLVKWTILYGSSRDSRHLKPVTDYQVNQLVNRAKDLGNNVREIAGNDDVFLLIRSLAYQQLWAQQREYLPDEIARQYLLFGSLENNHAFHKAFKNITCVAISDFLELSMALCTAILTDKVTSISDSYFSNIESKYESRTIPDFLDALSKTIPNAREWLQEEYENVPENYRSVEYEYFAPTPFIRHPLIKAGDQYFVISPDLLLQSLSNFIYDTLRRDNAQVFTNRFGIMFERLVGRSITTVQNAVLTEDALRRHFSNTADQQVVDYLIIEKDCNIFVEAKAVAMSLQGMVTDRPGTVRSQTKASVIKGIEQAISLAHVLGKGAKVAGETTGTKQNYLLIVTYKELYVGNGQQFYDVFASKQIEKILKKYNGGEHLPLSNIFIVSMNEFDVLLGSIHRGSKTLTDYMHDAVLLVQESGALTPFRNLIFQEGDGFATLPYLNESLTALYARLERKLTE